MLGADRAQTTRKSVDLKIELILVKDLELVRNHYCLWNRKAKPFYSKISSNGVAEPPLGVCDYQLPCGQ